MDFLKKLAEKRLKEQQENPIPSFGPTLTKSDLKPLEVIPETLDKVKELRKSLLSEAAGNMDLKKMAMGESDRGFQDLAYNAMDIAVPDNVFALNPLVKAGMAAKATKKGIENLGKTLTPKGAPVPKGPTPDMLRQDPRYLELLKKRSEMAPSQFDIEKQKIYNLLREEMGAFK